MRAILCCIALSGCATMGQVPTTVSIPVAVSCVPKDAPTLPSVTPQADLLKLEDRGFVLRLASERLDLLDYGRKASAILDACR